MKLMRNDPERGGLGKYALIRLTKLTTMETEALRDSSDPQRHLAAILADHPEFIEFGWPRTKQEAFVLKLKDRRSTAALEAYAMSCASDCEMEMAREVDALANRAGHNSAWCEDPD